MTSFVTRWTFTRSLRPAAGCLLLLFLFTPVVAQDVDENLYLFRTLELQYTLWPTNIDDPDQFAIDLRKLRDDLIRTRTYIQANPHLDPRLAESYSNALELLDVYRMTIGEITGIEIDLKGGMMQDGVGSGVKAVTAGFMIGEPVSGTLVGGTTFAIDFYTKSKRRNHDAQMAIEATAQAFEDGLLAELQRAKLLGQELTREYGWGPHEAGFELSKAFDQRFAQLVAARITRG